MKLIEQLRKENPYPQPTFDDKVRAVAQNIQYRAYDVKCEMQKQFPRHQSRIDFLLQIENAINFVGETANFYEQVYQAGNLHSLLNCRDH